MHARPPGRVPVFAAALVPVLAAWNNVVVARLSGPMYVAVNGAASAALLTAARRVGLTWAELGLDPRRLSAGARWGAALSAPVAAGYATALALPSVRPVLRDARVAGLSARDVAGDVLVRIPVATVLWEEVAFRGALQAALGRLMGDRTATAAGALLFGVWHVRPTLAALAANDLAGGSRRRATAVLLAGVGTGAAGVLFSGLRRRSGSLLAPVLLHLTVNAVGLLAAVAAQRAGRVSRGRRGSRQ